MKLARITLIACILVLLVGCNETEPILFTAAESPHHITKDIETEVGQSITIEAGAELIVDDGINIVAFGDVFIKGTEEAPIMIRAKNQNPGWGYLKLKNEAKQFIIEHATIQDGTLTSFNSNNNFSNVRFINRQDLDWEWAAARFWFGKVLIENCSVKGVNKAEGFLLHDVNDAIVRNCYFETIPDGVEYINCDRGEISNNTFVNGGDDAIDLNGCNGTSIFNNKITGYADAGMEIGSENFGRSSNIKVDSNVIKDCKIGIILKESSTAIFEVDSLINNKIGMDVSTPADSTILSQAKLSQCHIESKELNIKQDKRSKVLMEQ